MFNAGKGVSSVDAWRSTALDTEEILSNARHGDFHIFVADVVKSFDTVDRDILDCALGDLDSRHGSAGFTSLPQRSSSWIYTSHRARSRMDEVWEHFMPPGADTWKALNESLLSSMRDNLWSNSNVDTLLAAAQYTVPYVKVVGQEASPSKCVLLSTSKAARKRMTAWRNENAGSFRAVMLDVRDLGGHLDVAQRALAGTLSSRVKEATSHVIAVGALSMGFQRMLGLVCSKCLPAGLHGCEGAPVSVSAFSAFRSAVARAVWSKKLSMTNTPALLILLDGPWGSDPAFFVIWSRVRQLRQYLAYKPDEVDRVYRLLDYASTGSPGHGPIHLLLDSALEVGLSWNRRKLAGLGQVFLLRV